MSTQPNAADVGVLGAGIMGCCLALKLAQQGYHVDLIDQSALPISGASLHNEGKLHLGFVYAKDPSRSTHPLMLRGSLAFSNILEQLTGCSPEDLKPSRPFHYFIPNDSQMTLDEIQGYFCLLEEDLQAEVRSSGNLYLGRTIDRFFIRNSDAVHASLFSPDFSIGSFFTQEIAVSPVAVAEVIRKAVRAQPKIDFIADTEILGAEFLPSGEILIDTRKGGVGLGRTYPCVANCLWDGKLKIDQRIGYLDPGPWISRYKITINLKAQQALKQGIPSATGILGSYGDVVNHGNGSYYLSWYPLCKSAQSVNDDGRLLHDQVHKHLPSRLVRKIDSNFPGISKVITSTFHRKFLSRNISALSRFIPALQDLLQEKVEFELGGGVILARGSTDIDDPDSYLHQRSKIGPVVYQNYLTIDTGKYCTAPYFALQAAGLIQRDSILICNTSCEILQ